MASWMVHLRVADAIAKAYGMSGKAYDDFIIGNVAPDSGRMNADGLTYTPPKTVTHFKTSEDGVVDPDRFDSEQMKTADAKSFFFRLGYLSHLLTDRLWAQEVYYPTKRRFGHLFSTKLDYVTAVKHDWYGLDRMFVRDCPDFAPLAVLSEHTDFDEPMVDFVKSELVRETICRIVAFYGEPYVRAADDPYVYMTKEQMTDFVASATACVTEYCKDYLKIASAIGV